MFNIKTLLAAASLAVLTTAGTLSAGAAPWDRGFDRHDRFDRYEHRQAHVDHFRIRQELRAHRLFMISDPFFLHGRYVVRTQDRFGRVMLMQVDPWTGTVIRRL